MAYTDCPCIIVYTCIYICTVLNRMVVSMTYYGLSLNTGNLAGDFYLNFFLTAVMDFPAYTMCLMLMDRWGRKKCHCSAMILGGIACLSTILTTTFGGKGKHSCFVTSFLIFLYLAILDARQSTYFKSLSCKYK